MAEDVGAIVLLPGRDLRLRHEGAERRIDPTQQRNQSCADGNASDDEPQQRPRQSPEE